MCFYLCTEARRTRNLIVKLFFPDFRVRYAPLRYSNVAMVKMSRHSHEMSWAPGTCVHGVMEYPTSFVQPRSQGTLSTSRKYPGYGWSRVCKVFGRFQRCDWREGLESCLALSLPTQPSREWNLQSSRCVDRQKSQRKHSIRSMFG